MTRPNFFIVGAPKCGTTAWHSYLSDHPDIAFSRTKEPHYFNTDMPGFRWSDTEDDYLALFDTAGGAPICGEASVQYLLSHAAAANIAEFAPKAKILIFVRDPVAFLKSYHNQSVLNLDEDIEDFAAAWAASATLATRKLPSGCRDRMLLDYRNAVQFGAHTERYLAYFPAKQVMIVDFADWTSDPRGAYLRILRFLDLKDDGRVTFDKVHEAKRMASRSVGRLTQRPPAWVLGLARLLRRITGRERLGLAEMLRKANARSGYGSAAGQDVDDAIRAFVASDQAVLREQKKQLDAAHG